MGKWDEPSNCAIGRYGQPTGIQLVANWFPTNLLRFAHNTTAWFSTAVMRDDELQALPLAQHEAEFTAAINNEQNRFSKYVRFTAPEEVAA